MWWWLCEALLCDGELGRIGVGEATKEVREVHRRIDRETHDLLECIIAVDCVCNQLRVCVIITVSGGKLLGCEHVLGGETELRVWRQGHAHEAEEALEERVSCDRIAQRMTILR